MSEDLEFYIGYAATVGAAIRRQILLRVLLVLALASLGVFALVISQEDLVAKHYEYEIPREFEGILHLRPTPVLAVGRPNDGRSLYWLVSERKFGVQDLVRDLDGQSVRLRGRLIYRGARTMIEVLEGSVERIASGATGQDIAPSLGGGRSLGQVRLEGEIVDSKCFLGAMNPGRSKVHRACAVRCISGGIPPALWIHDGKREEIVLLVDSQGNSVHERVLDLVAEPVQIEGELWDYDDLLVLRSDPQSYRRIAGEPDSR